MTRSRTGTCLAPQRAVPAMDRVLMVIALGLDPRYRYTNY